MTEETKNAAELTDEQLNTVAGGEEVVGKKYIVKKGGAGLYLVDRLISQFCILVIPENTKLYGNVVKGNVLSTTFGNKSGYVSLDRVDLYYG